MKDDNVLVSQHFFALKLTKGDVITVLTALKNASVVTDLTNHQIVNGGGPPDVQAALAGLGTQSNSHAVVKMTLSTGVVLIAKPSALHVPPWQMVSAELGSVPVRAATWWERTPNRDPIPSTSAGTSIDCWDGNLGTAGAVEIATTGQWNGNTFGLEGGLGSKFNHAKIGVSTDAAKAYSIFGDMNQEGALSGTCGVSQNGRGGLFYVVANHALHDSVADLISGDSAPTTPVSAANN